MTQYLETDADGFAVALYNNRDEPPTVAEGHSAIPMETPVHCLPDGATPTQRQKWTGAALVWVETATLDEIKARAVAEIDRDADASRLMVVGDAARIKEYERAEQQAAAFRDAGFVGEAPPCVACWATAKEWTAQQAAEDILVAATRWISALEGIRALRLQAKEDVRRALAGDEVSTIRNQFSATLTATMQGV